MIMEFILNKEKAEALGYTVEACYDVLDRLFEEYSIKAESQGFYKSSDDQNMFNACTSAICRLPDSNWFLKVVDEWYWRVDSDNIDDREDCLADYYAFQRRK